jgi:hypothetical protein
MAPDPTLAFVGGLCCPMLLFLDCDHLPHIVNFANLYFYEVHIFMTSETSWCVSYQFLSHNSTFPAFITRFHKNDMKPQNSFITMQIRKVRRSTIRSSNLKKTASRPLKLLTMAIKDIVLSPRLVQEDFLSFMK